MRSIWRNSRTRLSKKVKRTSQQMSKTSSQLTKTIQMMLICPTTSILTANSIARNVEEFSKNYTTWRLTSGHIPVSDRSCAPTHCVTRHSLNSAHSSAINEGINRKNPRKHFHATIYLSRIRNTQQAPIASTTAKSAANFSSVCPT